MARIDAGEHREHGGEPEQRSGDAPVPEAPQERGRDRQARGHELHADGPPGA
jgi:hypothetical protein